MIGMFLGLGALAPKMALAGTHNYVNYNRSSLVNHIFVQQSVDGEYGKYVSSIDHPGSDDGTQKAGSSTESENWKGYGIGTSLGLEIMNFVQFTAGHTFVNMRHKDDSLESLSGSRLHAGARLVFEAPVANLELGGGLLGSRMDYQKQLENASFYGSGVYYSLGLNYFTSSQVSFYFEAKMSKEHLVQSGGSANVKSIDTNTTSMGLGFRIWM
jgi:hypothetical protein